MASRILMQGTIAARPYVAGNTWMRLNFLLGFRRLGFEAYFVEEVPAGDAVDETGRRVPLAASLAARYFREVTARFGLTGYAALLQRDGEDHVGLSRADVADLAPDVDLFVNEYGRLRWILPRVRRSVYLDPDPGYTQIWQEGYGCDMDLRDHDLYITPGLGLGSPDCPLPTAGVEWQTFLWPVVLEEWTTALPPGTAYTTVGEWRGFSEVEWQGTWFEQKADAFLRVVDLPRLVGVPLELCLSIDPADPGLSTLAAHRWRVVRPEEHVPTPDAYREYLFRSRGEFSCVKGVCSRGRSGWFSDRTACYLAAGRPAIVESTGVERYLPAGTGFLTFDDVAGAAAAIREVEADYARHAAAAAALAREYLDSGRVLTRLLELADV